LKYIDEGLAMPLYEVSLKGDDIYSLRILASDPDEAVNKALGIVTHVSEKNLPNYKVQVAEIETDRPLCGLYEDTLADS
jgi:hypothetical protein